MTLGNSKIILKGPKEVKREDLKNIYDLCNKIFNTYDECFYTSDEVLELKKDENNIFLT